LLGVSNEALTFFSLVFLEVLMFYKICRSNRITTAATAALLFFLLQTGARAQTTAFTFQGRLNDNGTIANGSYDIQLKLYDTAGAGTGTQIGVTTFSGVSVTNGVFTVQPDFTANAFPGPDRFVEVGVKPGGSGNPFTILSPRQPITPAPYALHSLNSVTANSATNATTATTATSATTATNSTQLGGQPASNYVQTADARLSDARVPLAGSTNYIQNTTTQETGNFNISGTGLVGSKVGVGTTTPQSRLHVNGTSWFQGDTTPLPNTAGKGIALGFGGEQGYIQAFDYTAFTPKNLLLNNSGGNVGIGTVAPAHLLDLAGGPLWTSNSWTGSVALNNGAAIAWRGDAGGQRFGLGQSSGGLYFIRTASEPGTTASPATYDMAITDAGNVGMGTISPLSKLTLQTATGNYGLTHTDGTTTVGSYVNATGGWLGTRSNHKLYFFTGDGGPSMTVDTTGNVGIGTIAPTSKLEIAAQDGLKITGFQPFLTLRDTNSANNSSYIQSAGGNLFVHSDAGNMIQPRNNNGLMKAMALIKDDGTVSVCYNSQAAGVAVNTSPCGIAVTFENNGDYLLDFGFAVTDRFISVTPRTFTDSGTAPIDVTATVGTSSNVNQTRVFLRSSDGARSGFYIFVY
jgi:hypothetical protein